MKINLIGRFNSVDRDMEFRYYDWPKVEVKGEASVRGLTDSLSGWPIYGTVNLDFHSYGQELFNLDPEGEIKISIEIPDLVPSDCDPGIC